MIPMCLALNRHPALASVPVWAKRMATFYLTLPWLSLVLHLSIAHYVFNIGFYGAEVAPLLLGLTLVLNKSEPTSLMPRKDLLALKVVLPLAAIFVSLGNPPALCSTIGRHLVFSITTTKLAGAGTYLTYVFCFAPGYFLQWLVVGGVTVFAWSFAPTFDQTTDVLTRGWNWSSDLTGRLMPKTAMKWGGYFIASAFALLGVGAAVSVVRRESTGTET
jgi:hypothetical protein